MLIRICAVHSQGIIHGDLNGGNVLINDTGMACLVDFGLSTIQAEFEGTSYITSTVGGAIRYRAPELFPSMAALDELCNFIPTLTYACDIYSLGSLIFQVRHHSSLCHHAILTPFILDSFS